MLKAAGMVPILVPLIGVAALKGAAKSIAIFITIRVIKDVKAIAPKDAPRANTPPRLEVTVGIKTALVAVKEATLLVAIAPLAKPRVPTLAPILVIKAQSLLREVLISAAY